MRFPTISKCLTAQVTHKINQFPIRRDQSECNFVINVAIKDDRGVHRQCLDPCNQQNYGINIIHN